MQCEGMLDGKNYYLISQINSFLCLHSGSNQFNFITKMWKSVP